MRILTLEIANGITNQSRVHDQHKPAKKYQLIDNTIGILSRLVLIMHSTLIGYAIGLCYLQNQDPHRSPRLLI